jgi:4-hydroxy-3-methylbut-2-en-1-yl diphosphate synthase IspG/GcpE
MGIPIRIGLNSGSLPRDLAGKADKAAAIVGGRRAQLAVFDDFGFTDAWYSSRRATSRPPCGQ